MSDPTYVSTVDAGYLFFPGLETLRSLISEIQVSFLCLTPSSSLVISYLPKIAVGPQ